MASQWIVGEPYELRGKRICFASWYFIRPGRFGWYDKSGQGLSLQGEGNWKEGVLKTFDSPTGIRIVANRGQRLGPVLRAQKEWEKDGYPILGTIIQEKGKYRAWGTVGGWGD